MRKCKKVHFLGVGGVSMSGLAQYLAQNGYVVSGSDLQESICISGVDTRVSAKKQNIAAADVVVVSAAIKQGDPDLVYAESLDKKIVQRGKVLGQIASTFSSVVAVAGTHGKTSTTEMLSEVFVRAGMAPTVHIGANSGLWGSNLLVGEKDVFITEACEYGASFLGLRPDVGVVLNLEPEHLDFFGTYEREQACFGQFCEQCKVVVAKAGLGIKNAITFGEGGTYQAKNVQKTSHGFSFQVTKAGENFVSIDLLSINQKNVENVLAVVAVCDYMGVDMTALKEALASYKGVARRMEFLSDCPLVIADYAHHPTEIKASIESVKNFFEKPVCVVFQPHTYSRTKALFDEFLGAFDLADKIILLPTYPARESPNAGLPSEAIFIELRAQGKNVFFAKDVLDAKKLAFENLGDGLCLVLGAGDIYANWQA